MQRALVQPHEERRRKLNALGKGGRGKVMGFATDSGWKMRKDTAGGMYRGLKVVCEEDWLI